VQTKDIKYTPLIGPNDKPAIELNRDKMEKFLPELQKRRVTKHTCSSWAFNIRRRRSKRREHPAEAKYDARRQGVSEGLDVVSSAAQVRIIDYCRSAAAGDSS
jgi:hypothetical protein